MKTIRTLKRGDPLFDDAGQVVGRVQVIDKQMLRAVVGGVPVALFMDSLPGGHSTINLSPRFRQAFPEMPGRLFLNGLARQAAA